MDRQELLRALQREILRHQFDTFVDEPPSMAQGGRGIVCPGLCTKPGRDGYEGYETSSDLSRTIPSGARPKNSRIH